MIEEAIVHVGMHKTGSSSIQDTLHNLASEPGAPVRYLKLNSPNHSGFFMTLLSEQPEEYRAHKINGCTKAEARAIQQRFESDLEERLSAFGSRRLVVSGEGLSAPGVTEGMLVRLKRLLLRHCRSVRVIGYVRAPVGYMQSAFQQRLKAGVQRDLDGQTLWPHYRKRFGTLDQVFGKENVVLVPFSPDSLYQGDVVLDFARRTGFELSREDLRRTNESISLEACAVLFAMRKLEKVAPYGGYLIDNERLVRAVSCLGKGKLVFSPELVQPVLQAHCADLDWINERLGQSIEDEPRDASNSIESETDLLDVAVKHSPELWRLLEEEAVACEGRLSTAELVDRLSQLTARGPLAHQREVETTQSGGGAALHEGDPASLLEQAAQVFAQTTPEVASAFRRLVGPAQRQASRIGVVDTSSVQEDR